MSSPTYRSVAYFANWSIYARQYRPQYLPVQHLTHILYAFANIRDTGEVVLTDSYADVEIHWEKDSWNDTGHNLYGCVKQLYLLKKANRHLKVLLSIGGWTYSPKFAPMAATSASRSTFAATAVKLATDWGFDGLDIDWEYPQSTEEATNYVALLYECRRALDDYGNAFTPTIHFELTVACPASAKNFDNLNIPAMDQYLDFWNLMAYDYAGSWDMLAGHQANLHASRLMPHTTPFNTTDAVNLYLGKGVNPSKLVMGMPLYGRAFEKTEGLGRPYDGVGEGSWEKGVYDFKALPLPGTEVTYDPEVVAAICYGITGEPPNKRKVLVTYDNRDVAVAKANYIRERGLGGAMWWESSSDRQGPESLIRIVTDTLGGPGVLQQRSNCVMCPETQYENLRDHFAQG
ncbi:glycoside hydrolase family 18 protein [Ophiostoma piceae UAMH 11346]|uniref:chitinase n=1 Tax=Ophiostoma piceae (strain UAMH 11346) TaxID=1262450 RepID=S3CG16_OPHP1|nr:glycoside hydrolase family 18 protein [Ophiostoma piceae UAMH 11346]